MVNDKCLIFKVLRFGLWKDGVLSVLKWTYITTNFMIYTGLAVAGWASGRGREWCGHHRQQSRRGGKF